MEDLQKHGCISGMIPELIYYDDTNKFYDTYKADINELLSEITQGSGLSTEEFFGDNFDKNDQIRLANYLKNTKAKFMLVIKNTEFIYNLYKNTGFNIISFDKKYLVSFMNRNDKDVEHLIITNYEVEGE